jgi:ATP-binding cassette subfamily B protein
MTTTTEVKPTVNTWKYLWELIKFRPWLFLLLGFLETLFFAVFPQITGLIMREYFNTLTGNAALTLSIDAIVALLIAVALARAGAIFADVAVYFKFRYMIAALLRKNMFERILDLPGARAIPDSPGEAISRFRGDVDEVAFFMAESLTPIAFGIFAVVAVIVMAGINLTITLVVLIPLVLVIFAANAAMKGLQKYREAHRTATGKVTGFIAEMFGAAQATKVASAEKRVINRFATLNETRRQAALKDRPGRSQGPPVQPAFACCVSQHHQPGYRSHSSACRAGHEPRRIHSG